VEEQGGKFHPKKEQGGKEGIRQGCCFESTRTL